MDLQLISQFSFSIVLLAEFLCDLTTLFECEKYTLLNILQCYAVLYAMKCYTILPFAMLWYAIAMVCYTMLCKPICWQSDDVTLLLLYMHQCSMIFCCDRLDHGSRQVKLLRAESLFVRTDWDCLVWCKF